MCIRDRIKAALAALFELEKQLVQTGDPSKLKIDLWEAGKVPDMRKNKEDVYKRQVYINTKSMKNREVAEGLNGKANKLAADGSALADRIYEDVRKSLI